MLSKEEKLNFIIKKSEELGVTAYEYGNNTELSDIGARNILNGESKNPRTKNLDIMLNYLENKVLGTQLNTKSEAQSFVKEPNQQKDYKMSNERFVQIRVTQILDRLLNHEISKTEAISLISSIQIKELENN